MDRQALRDEKIASAILDVCYEDSGNIDVLDLAGQVLVRLGFKCSATLQAVESRYNL